MNPILEVEHFNLSFTQYDRGSRRRQFTDRGFTFFTNER